MDCKYHIPLKQDDPCWLELTYSKLQNETSFVECSFVSGDKATDSAEIEIKNKVLKCKLSQLSLRSKNTYDYSDLTEMEVVNDAEILNNIKKRYQQDKIYNFLGPTLISTNPFKKINGLYSDHQQSAYIKNIIHEKSE